MGLCKRPYLPGCGAEKSILKEPVPFILLVLSHAAVVFEPKIVVPFILLVNCVYKQWENIKMEM